MSWPILLPFFAVGLICGALLNRWHTARRIRKRSAKIEVTFPLPVPPMDRSTEYTKGRQGRERLTF